MPYKTKDINMRQQLSIKTFGFSLLAVALLAGCGNSITGGGMGGGSGGDMSGSNIQYLKVNHANYSENGSTQTPAPVKDANAKSITWTIAATTEEGATKLQEHLTFMETQLKNDQNPRAFDKLFLMEAYMKFNKHYTTLVERSGTNVVVSKNAKTTCAYKVISAHSDAVSGDFFGRGEIMNDYSSVAEGILASSDCNDVRTSLQTYISQRQKSRGMM